MYVLVPKSWRSNVGLCRSATKGENDVQEFWESSMGTRQSVEKLS